MADPVPLDWQRPTYHPTYARMLVAMVRSRGGDPAAALAGTGLTPAGLQGEERFVSFDAIRRLVEAAMAGSGLADPLEIGNATPATAHGALGTAVATAPTLGHAAGVACRYLAIRATAFEFRPIPTGGFEAIEVIDYRFWRRLMADSVAALMARLFESAIGRPLAGAHFRFPYPAPAEPSIHAARLGGRVSFGAERLEIHLPPALLAAPVIAADAVAHLAACRECEREIAARQAEAGLADRIRRRLAERADDPPSLDETAATLGLTPRTLIRRLAREGTRYQALLDETRVALAEWYLAHTPEPVEAIAVRLGYADPSNFSRTFRRWRGTTPGAFRVASRREG